MTEAITDPEAGLEFLIDHGAIREDEDGSVTTTAAFEKVRGIYHDSYADADEERFRETVAEVFDLPTEEAAARIEDHGLTRGELVAFLALRSFLDADLPRPDLAVLAAVVAEATPPSPVPPDLRELTDEDYAAFLDDHPDAVVIVWRRQCDPCDRLKAELDEIRSAAPDGVAFAGVDGEEVVEFRREFGIEAAPTTLLFSGGDPVARRRGYHPPDELRETFADAY